jgi:carbonic anhydrase/acetyltransferase-like protein (isoleucine patch superfamily)
MATMVELDGMRPALGVDVYLAPTATLIGDVRIGDRASVWFGAVLRADFAPIEVGDGTSVQDNVVVHAASGLPTRIGADVTVGHGALLEGCTVEDGAVIGMGAVVLQRARVGRGAVLAAGAVLAEGAAVAAGLLAAGVPAREKKELSGSAQAWAEHAASAYQGLRVRYLTSSAVLPQPVDRA